MNVDRDIVDGGCNGEVLSDGVIGEKGVVGDTDESDWVMNEVFLFYLLEYRGIQAQD